MPFLIDKQTFADLEILEKEKKQSIFRLFDRTASDGGRQELSEMFYNPLNDAQSINERQDFIHYIYSKKLSFPINKSLLDFIEFYFRTGDKPTKISFYKAFDKAIRYLIKPTNDYYVIKRGIEYTIELLQILYTFVTKDAENEHQPALLKKYINYIEESIGLNEFSRLITIRRKKRISPIDIERLDYAFRYKEFDRLKKLLKIVYQIDAFQSVADTAYKLDMVFPEITDNKEIEITGLYHPFLDEAVTNNVRLDECSNLFFITGANMAGKSTFLKAFGVAVYLAHLGFPVAAKSMKTGIFNGLFSTINIADNINKGYSHFYSEVLRVKNVAKEINQTGNLIVIFDELFRGTNVKDAYDASLAIISAFAKVKGSLFLVSTHIMEIAEALRTIENIRFGYFHTTIEGKTPVYSYTLREGVTDERLGMLIIENERIIEIIENKQPKFKFPATST